MALIQIVYVSTAVEAFTNAELLDLLDRARKKNEKLGITGMLLYKGGDFMQALEGNEAEVHALKAEIAKDPRHKEFVTLLDAPSSKREFPDWTMGFQNLDEVDPTEIPGYNTFLDSPLRAHTFTDNPANCRKLLLTFKNQEHASKAH